MCSGESLPIHYIEQQLGSKLAAFLLGRPANYPENKTSKSSGQKVKGIGTSPYITVCCRSNAKSTQTCRVRQVRTQPQRALVCTSKSLPAYSFAILGLAHSSYQIQDMNL